MEIAPSAARPALPAAMGLLCGVVVGSGLSAAAAIPLGALLGGVAIWRLRTSHPARGWLAAVGFFLIGSGVDAVLERGDAHWIEAGLHADGRAVVGHVCGTLVRPVERNTEGAWYLEIEGWLEQKRQGPCERTAAASRPGSLRLLLKIYPSPPDATVLLHELDVGDEVRVWCRIRRPTGAGNPDSRDPVERLRVSGLDGFGTVKNARLIERRRLGQASLARFAGRLRIVARRRLDLALGARGARRGLAGAVLLGDRRGIPVEVIRSLRQAGLSHLIAISGLHVGILVTVLVFALRRVRVRGWLLCGVAIPLVVLFVLFVGSRPSVMRAGAAAVLIMIARSSGREGESLNGLSVILLFLIATHPAVVGDVGFQLTFLATAGILAFAASSARSIPLPRAVSGAIAVSLSAYAATAPAVARHFGMLTPVGLLSNLIAVPLCALLLIAGYATILFAPVGPLGEGAGAVLIFALDGILAVGRFCGDGLDGSFYVAAPSRVTLAVNYSAMAVMALGYAGGRRDGRSRIADRVRKRVIAWIAGLALTWVHLGPPPPESDGRTHVALIDVGQGQALAMRGPLGGTVLVDAGGAYGSYDPGEREVVPFLLNWSGRRVDCLVLSHADLDHSGGALAVIRSLEVGQLWVGPDLARSERLQEIASAVREGGGAVVLVRRGSQTEIGGLPLHVLSPDRDRIWESSNANSLVLLAGRAPARILIPGDIGSEVETLLARGNLPLRSEALVLSHHGSRDGSTQEFLARVAAGVAVVSCGKRNPFGHPSEEVLDRLARRGIELYRTDAGGMIQLDETVWGWEVRRPGSE